MSAVLAGREQDQPWAAAPTPPPERLQPWLAAYERRLAALTAAQTEYECRRLGVPASAAAQRAWHAARDAWLGPAAPVSAFAACANRLALLDGAALRRVLAGRALYASRGRLRRVVSGTQRRAMAVAIGEQGFDVLLKLGMQAASCGAALPDQMDDNVLAASGHAMIAADGALTLGRAARLVLLTLDQASAGHGHAAAVEGNGGAAVCGGADGARRIARAAAVPAPSAAPAETTRFLALAPLIFPELTWLFG